MVPHSHMDPGWIYNVDQYYTGDGTYSPTKLCARCILNSVLESLITNDNRTFTCTEIIYFVRWYKEISEAKRNVMRQLINNGRFNFVGNGLVMHDEATTNYKDIINNMRIGIEFLKKEFNIVVETGWYIDTFGHSAANVYI